MHRYGCGFIVSYLKFPRSGELAWGLRFHTLDSSIPSEDWLFNLIPLSILEPPPHTDTEIGVAWTYPAQSGDACKLLGTPFGLSGLFSRA